MTAKRFKAEEFLIAPITSMRLRWPSTSMFSTHLSADAARNSQDFSIGEFEVLCAVRASQLHEHILKQVLLGGTP
jgi:hypothetical protein